MAEQITPIEAGGATRSFRVQRGRLLVYRLFDLGDEFLLDRARQLLAAPEAGQSWRLARAGAPTLSIKHPPLELALGRRSLELAPGRTLEADVHARLFDFGTLSIRFALEIAAGTPLEELGPLCGQLDETPLVSREARRVLDDLYPRVREALIGGPPWAGNESYTIVYLEEVEGRPLAEMVLAQREQLARVLLGEGATRRLSSSEVAESTRLAYSYLVDDLVVIDWAVALVIEPTGAKDVTDLLEYASAQLAALRGYDDQLDEELDRIYDEVESLGRRPLLRLLRSPYARLARQVQERWLDMTEVTEKIENSIKVVGDQFLSRVYRSATERFRIPLWQSSVYRKQSQIAQVYELLKGDVDTRRNVILELAIVLLIVLEIVLYLDK